MLFGLWLVLTQIYNVTTLFSAQFEMRVYAGARLNKLPHINTYLANDMSSISLSVKKLHHKYYLTIDNKLSTNVLHHLVNTSYNINIHKNVGLK